MMLAAKSQRDRQHGGVAPPGHPGRREMRPGSSCPEWPAAEEPAALRRSAAIGGFVSRHSLASFPFAFSRLVEITSRTTYTMPEMPPKTIPATAIHDW